jgi:hypothetical protein
MGLLVNFNTDRIENGRRRMAHRPFVRPSCSSWLRAANTPERSRADPKVRLYGIYTLSGIGTPNVCTSRYAFSTTITLATA